jgi:hypothetical protein
MTATGRCGERAANQPPLVPFDIFALVPHCTRWPRAVFAATSIASGASIAAAANRALVLSLIHTSSRCSARGRTPDARADFRTFGIDPRPLVIARLDTLFDNLRREDCACRQQSPNSGQQIVIV